MKESISSFLSMQTALNQRRTQLNELKNAATSHSYDTYDGTPGKKTISEPTYDIKKVDKKLTDINKALFKIDQAIKRSNAMTEMDLAVDFDSLMSEIE